MMKRFRFSGGDASTAIRVVTIVVIVLGAIVTGSVSLILEDILPKSDPQEAIVASRWVFLGSSVLLVAFAVWLRYEVRSFSGTLFSLQVLDEGVTDRLNEGGMDFRLAADRRYMYLRSIHRWVDYEYSVHHGVLDLHELSHEIGVALEELLNTAPDEGKKTVAPNMPWPMSMAVGAYLPARHSDIHILELPRQEDDKEHEFPLRPAAPGNTVPSARKIHRLPQPTGHRVGALVTLDTEAGRDDIERLRSFGASTVYTVNIPLNTVREGPPSRYEEPELESCGHRIAEELTSIRREHPDDELVVAAELSSAVALSVGWHLTQHTCHLYRNTYLLYFDGERFVPMRVRPSQPRHFDS